MAAHGGSDGFFVTRDARDQRRAGHAVRVEFLDPSRRERLGRVRRFPAELAAQVRDGLRSATLGRQGGEEAVREEVTVSVVDHAAILLALRAHRIVSAMAATMRLDHHLTHPIASRSGQSVAHRQPQCPMANEIVIAAGRSGGM